MANVAIIEAKQQKVTEVADKLRESSSTVVADYRGLTVAQMTELRRLSREAGVELEVIKNSLISRAADQTSLSDLNQYLPGPSIVAFSKDPVAAAKVLSDFSKQNDALKLKAGVIDGKVFNDKDIKALADLPSREGLLSMLLSVLQAPVRNFALAVKAVAEQKEGN